MKLIVCAGLYRSASTWQYNVVRLMLGGDPLCGYMNTKDDIKQALASRFAIIKIHPYNLRLANAADVILTSHRDPRQVLASSLGITKPVPYDTYGRLPRWRAHLRRLGHHMKAHTAWTLCADYDMAYAEFIKDPKAAATRIWECLGKPECDIAKVLEGVEKLYKNARGDAKELFWVEHRTRGKVTLTPFQELEVSCTFLAWMRARGYFSAKEAARITERCFFTRARGRR